MPDGLFIFFAALTLGAAALLVLSRNPVTSAMGMILALVGVAADFFLLDAYFLGVLQVLVYAGAVMVLFLFIIMLMNSDDPTGAYPWKTLALGLATFFLLRPACFGCSNGRVPSRRSPRAQRLLNSRMCRVSSPLRPNLLVAYYTVSTCCL